MWTGIAQSEETLATGWMVRGSIPDGKEVFRALPDRPWSLPILFPGGNVPRAWPQPPTPNYRQG